MKYFLLSVIFLNSIEGYCQEIKVSIYEGPIFTEMMVPPARRSPSAIVPAYTTWLNQQMGGEFKLTNILSKEYTKAVNQGYPPITHQVHIHYFEKDLSLSKLNAKLKALEDSIDTISGRKVDAATAELRKKLLDAMKDAQLYEGAYKDAIIDAALVKFRQELIDFKNELKK